MAPDPDIRERVESLFRELLRSRDLLPGTVVPIARLARRWRVSETPIRDICWRAVGEGQLVAERRGGFRVREPGIDELRDMYEALELVLIGGVALLPLGLANPASTASMEEIEGGLSILAIAARLGNTVYSELCDRLADRLAPFWQAEAVLLRDPEEEARTLARGMANRSRAEMRDAVRRYCRRRTVLAPATLGLISEWRRENGC